MYNHIGQCVIRNISSLNTNTYHIDISDLPAGFYLLRLSDEKGNSYSTKFVKTEGK
ncbi:MAG: T9SS type A sorting domain-containing protein [Bacteroidales bacterium]|nr:T9SS type A sorting domain-containing protein [Bacteroidales bacterium]